MKGKKREEMGLADVRASLYARILLAVADRVAIGHFSGPAGFSNPYHRGETLALTWIEKGTQCGWMGRPGSGEAPGPITEELLGGGTLELHLGGITDAIAFFEGRRTLPSRMGGWWRLLPWMRMLKLLARTKACLDSVKSMQGISDEACRVKIEAGLYAACCGVSAMVSVDPFCARLSSEQPTGRLRVCLAGSPCPLATIGIRPERWVMNPPESDAFDHEVDLVFHDGFTALQSVSGKLDNLAAVGDGRIRMSGYVPLADGFTHMTDRLQQFVRTG